MNLGEISVKLYDRLGYGTSPDSPVVRRLRGYVNDTHRTILSKRPYSKLRRAILTCSSVSGSPSMTLPQALIGIAVIADRTNRRNLDLITLQDLRWRDPGQAMTGPPDAYMVLNFSAPVATDPSAASTLWAISDAAGDGTGISVNVEGVTTGGYYKKASTAMGGVVAVQLDATVTDWLHITKFYLSGGATGNVTLRQGSGVGAELARIPAGHTYARYTQIHLSPVPPASLTYYVDGEVHLEDMIGPKDEPLLPEDYHDILIAGALVKEYTKRTKPAQVAKEESVYKDRMSDLTAFVKRGQGVARGGQRGSSSGFSQLGPMFPDGA